MDAIVADIDARKRSLRPNSVRRRRIRRSRILANPRSSRDLAGAALREAARSANKL